MDKLNRRDLMRLAGGAALSFAAAPLLWAAKAAPPIRLGFIGVGARGTVLLRLALKFPAIEIPFVCDIDEEHLKHAQDIVQESSGKRPKGFSAGPEAYQQMLGEVFDAVIIATPHDWHARMTIDALKARKFVGCEVPACNTLEECWQILKAQRETGTGYFMLENLCYSRPVMQVLNMAREGVFGDLTYGEGAYIHNVRSLKFNPDGSLTWRGENVLKNPGLIYPTHGLGPVCQWMGINRDDRLVSLVASSTRSAATHDYAVKKFGAESSAAKLAFKNGDSSTALISTEKGRMIVLRYDTASPRPSGRQAHALQGTKGAYESHFGIHNVYLESDSAAEPSGSKADWATGREVEKDWQLLEELQPKYDHPYWRERGEEALKAGHNGADYFVMSDFLDSVRSGKSAVDVVDALTWSVIRPLSAESLNNAGKLVEIPDFTKEHFARA
ncbi:MAG: Gfo/Idh/MocA family protein [Candidatus Sumerlaeaceae bacterium]